MDDIIERARAYVEKGVVQDGPAEVMAALAVRVRELERKNERLRGARDELYRSGWKFAYDQWVRTGSVPNPDCRAPTQGETP